jgi:hypothetical protein
MSVWFYWFYTVPKLASHFDELHDQQDRKWCTPQHSTETTPWCSLLSKFWSVLQYINKYNLIYTHMKVQPSPHLFSQNPQLLNSIICWSHTKFHLNWATCEKYRQLFFYASKWRTAISVSILIKLTITQQILWKTPVPNFTQIWGKIWKNSHNATLWVKYHVNRKVHNNQ